MAFGLEGSSPRVLLRNWLTFILRECIIKQEKLTFHNDLGARNIVHLNHSFNARVTKEVCEAYELLKHDQRIDRFNTIHNPDRVLFVDPSGGVQRENIVTIFNVP